MPLSDVVVWLFLPLLLLPGGASPVSDVSEVGCDYCGSGLWEKVCRQNCSSPQGPFQAWIDVEGAKTLFLNGTVENERSCMENASAAAGMGMICNIHTSFCCKVDPKRKCEQTECTTYKIMVGRNRNSSNYQTFFRNEPSVESVNVTSPYSPSSSSGVKAKKTKNKKSIFIIGGISIAGLLLLASCVVLLTLRKRHLLKSRRYSSDRAQILIDVTGSHNPTVFTFKELKSATKSFAESRLLGGGGFSTVYQGKLPDGRTVAVKKLNQGNKQGIQQFQNEVNILSKVRHSNLVQLLGYCLEGRDLLLVYEYVLNGTLADHLHGERGNGNDLALQTRLSIALDTAQALAYLHFLNPPIYHRDVKSSNILLDKDFRAKVADFGLSRLTHLDATHISTAPQGTPGYLDPDYHESYQLTDKSDVYSFGVVLLELISRKKAVDMSREKKEINLASMALAKIHSGELHELFDPDLSVKYWKLLTRLVEVAFRCLAAEKDDRPSMIEVVAELEQLASIGVMSFSSRKKIKLESSGELKKQRSSSKAEESPTSVQIKWPSTHTSPNNSKSEV